MLTDFSPLPVLSITEEKMLQSPIVTVSFVSFLVFLPIFVSYISKLLY